ncbi:MAG TPA: hypothetical protein VIO32_08545 [Candidatus Baltobacteraceae bacterium]
MKIRLLSAASACVFAASLGVCVTQSFAATISGSPQSQGTICSVANLPTPRSDGRSIPDYRAVVQRRIENCWRSLLSPSPQPTDSAGKEHLQQCDPRYSHRTDLAVYETLVDCVSYQPSAPSKSTPVPTPTVLFRSSIPVLYVFLPSPVPGSTTGVDNAGAQLLWSIATQMQADFYLNQESLVMPEPTWAAADFNNQCLGDRTGTMGGVSIGLWTATSAADNWLLVNNGWTQTAYIASFLTCSATPGPPTISRVFNVSGHSYRNQFSFLPLFLYWSYRLAAAGGSSQIGTGVLAGLAVTGSNSQLSSITLGNVGGMVTVPRAYIDSASNLDASIIDFCQQIKPSVGIVANLCEAQRKNRRVSPVPWGRWGKCEGPSTPLFKRPFC